MFSCEFCEVFNNTYFEELLGIAAYNIICFMKISHLLPQVYGKIKAEVFVSFGVVVPVSIYAFSNKSDFPVALHFHLICIDESNFKFCAIEL